MDRPSSAFSSRPSTASTVSSTESKHARDVFMQARVRLQDGTAVTDPPPQQQPTPPALPPRSPYKLEGQSPALETKLEDVVDDLPDHVLSRSGTPSQWAFDDKESSLKTSPPRPTSATLCSPPVPRKVPISVDHHLRK